MVACALARRLGANVAERRTKLGIQQRYLATVLGITPENLSRIECGKVSPALSTIEKLAEALNCSASYLLREPWDEDKNEVSKVTIAAEKMSRLPAEGQNAVLKLLSYMTDVK